MASFFAHVPLEPPNSVLGISNECTLDPYPKKINLTIGVYRTEDGHPYVLPSVRNAEEQINEFAMNHEYLVQDGIPEFNKAVQKLMFGEEASAISEGRVYTIQTVAGTGAVRLGAEFLHKIFPGIVCSIPAVTWQNHPQVLDAVGIPKTTYRYLLPDGCNLDFDGMLADLKALPEKSIVLMHSCAHNPSGCDPSDEQWKEILQVFQERKLFPFFDNAYQGFVSGDPQVDAYAVRLFAQAGLEMIVACSFSKNFGLYGQRVGALHVVTTDKDSTTRVASLIRAIARCLYSTCPAHGARIVSIILNDSARSQQWHQECKGMADRLNSVRHTLYDELIKANVKGTWKHIISQRGMFSFTGISPENVQRLKEEYHIYMLKDGRISLAGLNNSNIQRFVHALLEIYGTN